MRIIVIGPQRSGTNIAAAVIAKDKQLPLYSERIFGYSSCVISSKPDNTLIDFIHNCPEYVLQAPALNSYCHLIETDALFVWVKRSAEAVRNSRKRAGWPGEQIETNKYKRYHPELVFNDTVDAALMAWKMKQRHIVNHIEMEYLSLCESPLWKNERSDFSIGQIR